MKRKRKRMRGTPPKDYKKLIKTLTGLGWTFVISGHLKLVSPCRTKSITMSMTPRCVKKELLSSKRYLRRQGVEVTI